MANPAAAAAQSASQAWSEVHALDDRAVPPAVAKIAVQESFFVSFQEHLDPTDWRVRDFGVKAVLVFPNGNRLFVTETYAEIAALVGLKVK